MSIDVFLHNSRKEETNIFIKYLQKNGKTRVGAEVSLKSCQKEKIVSDVK